MLRVLPLFLLLLLSVLGLALIGQVNSHEESGEWHCDSDSETQLVAEFRPGVVTIDGHAEDWKDIDGFEFSLLPALDPDAENEYKSGKMTVKALHDGHDVFFMLQVDGDYAYSKGENKKCPSVALMFQIGEEASYHNMGGCKEGVSSCSSKTCKGHEVDIMHFSIGNAIPGRLYGGNPVDNSEGSGDDRFGHLVDVYAWNPHCRYLDGKGPSGTGNDSRSQNDWKGAWWHSSFSVHSGFLEDDSPYAKDGQKGTYYFEFSRPLRTLDRLQQDAQFTIGGTSKMSVAFWYPLEGLPWHGSGHFSVGCDWLSLDIPSGSSTLTTRATGTVNASSVFALLLSVISLCASIFVGYRVLSRPKTVPFTPMENL